LAARNLGRYIHTSNILQKQAIDINSIPLNECIPGLSAQKNSGSSVFKSFDAQISTLPNGLRIATEQNPGQYCTIGVAIDSGPRYEVHYPLGTSHMIEKLAFSSTKNYTRDLILKMMEERGALIDCQSTKDTFLYASSCRSDGFEEILSVIADAVYRPRFLDEEVELASDVITFENEALARNPECEPLLIDWIHAAAFQGNTLGLSKYCKSEAAKAIKRQHLFSYLSQYYTPDRIVVAGVGVDHNALKAAAEKLFDPTKTSWAEDPSLLLPSLPPVDKSVAQYTGGEYRVARDLSKIALGPAGFPNLAHFVLGFESVGLKHPDFVTFCVLNTLMGGGGSFSAGGPGKGMYTRLYVDVLHHHHWMYNATAFNHSYADAGVFSIRASGPPEYFHHMVRIILNEFLRLVDGVRDDELERAKVQLKSQIMMNLEMRPVQFEDLARQVLTHQNKRIKPEEYTQKIDAVTNTDIKRIAARMLSTKPSIVGYGDLKEMPTFEKIDSAVAKRSLKELDIKGSYWTSAFKQS